MKMTGYLAIGSVVLLVFAYSVLARAQEQGHEHGAPPAQATEEQTRPAEGPRMCSPDHMRMMLQNPEDKECVAESVLQDDETTEIVMDKIVADPDLRRRMMEKMHVQMQKRMMEHKGMKEGSGGEMQGEGGMMPREGGAMPGHGGMQQESK